MKITSFRLAKSILLLAALCLFASPSFADEAKCDPFDITVATTPIPPQKVWSLKRLEEQKKFLNEQADVVAIGDSLAERWPQEELNSLFPGRKVVNIGLGSDLTQVTLWRLSAIDYSKLNPTTVVMLLGTNNLGSMSACSIRMGLELVIDRMEEIWPRLDHIYLLKIIPKGEKFTQNIKQITDMNSEIDKINLRNGKIKIVEPMPRLSCGVENYGSLWYSIIMSLYDAPCENYEPDFTHLTPQGYKAMHSYLQNEFSR